VLIRTVLRQIEQRRETAVVVDPDCEFTAEFYRPERGDVVLNPLDARLSRVVAMGRVGSRKTRTSTPEMLPPHLFPIRRTPRRRRLIIFLPSV